jgi:hypothetical protein
MTKLLSISWLLMFAITSALQAGQVVRDHREKPGAAAQWKIDGGLVDSLNFHRFLNTARGQHLAARSSGGLHWETTSPGQGMVIFENCTRPGEVVYGSDRVAIRFGSRFLVSAAGASGLDWVHERERGCEFRLISGSAGFVPVGSGDGTFAIYNMQKNRYLVYRQSLTSLGLVWQETTNGRAPGGVVASADFVPVELVFTVGTIGDRSVQSTYLTIQNIGNVRSSASQQVMKVKIRGEEVDFPVIQPVGPGAILRQVVRMTGTLSHCETVPVELDTNPTLKFQVSRGGLPNDAVFANDRKTLFARNLNPPQTPAADIGCGPTRAPR